MRKLVLAVLLLSLASLSFAATDTLRLFYPINVSQLSAADKGVIKHIADSIDRGHAIVVKGYADYLYTRAYNQPLSAQRADSVKAYLLSLNPKFKISTEGEGSVEFAGKQIATGEPNDRRADIIFTKIQPAKKTGPVDPELAGFAKKIDSLSLLKVGQSLNLDELLFEGGRHFLLRSSEPYLEIVTAYLAAHPNIYFEVRGHVCCVPPTMKRGHYKNGRYVEEQVTDGTDIDTHDEHLSVNRARAIYNYLAQNGVDTARMTFTGVGVTQPKIKPEITETDKRRNRRVEIIVLRK